MASWESGLKQLWQEVVNEKLQPSCERFPRFTPRNKTFLIMSTKTANREIKMQFKT